MEIIVFAYGILGFFAFYRIEKLIKTLKKKGLLDDEYKAD